MSFQWIIDRAETISINSKKVVASTTARDGTVRSVSRGGQVWRFEVKLPDGIPWTELRPYITASESLDRVTSANIQMNSSGQNWIVDYLGAPTVTPTDIRFRTVTGNNSQIELFDRYFPPYVGISNGSKLLGAGDYIQLGTGGDVYRVTSDVIYSSLSFPIVNLNRPLLSTTFPNNILRIGPNVSWNVVCTQYPEWTLMGRDQVAWSGPFVFVENLI